MKSKHTSYQINGCDAIDPTYQCGGYLAIAISAALSDWPKIESICKRHKVSKKWLTEIELAGGTVDFKSGTLEQVTTYTSRMSTLTYSVDSGERNCPFQEMLSERKRQNPNLAIHIVVLTMTDLMWENFCSTTDVEQHIDDECFRLFKRRVSNPRSNNSVRKNWTRRKMQIASGVNPFD